MPYIPTLGAGPYQSGLIDFVELTPEIICRRTGAPEREALEFVPEQWAQARGTCGALPLVVHGVELSIGSACGWNLAYIDMLRTLQARWPFEWHSEHLHFQTAADRNGVPTETGVPLPLPLTDEAVSLVGQRAAEFGQRFGVPFLLENAAHYLRNLPRDPDIADEAEFMNRITEVGSCGHLLDLHNVYCNAVNHGFDPLPFLDRLRLDRVIEIHIAGGSEHEGVWMDAHDNRVPEPVWELLDFVLPRCPNLAGLVFEVLEEHVPVLGATAIVEEVARAKEAWRRGIA